MFGSNFASHPELDMSDAKDVSGMRDSLERGSPVFVSTDYREAG